MSDITSWERSAANNNSAPPDGAPEGMAPSTVNNTMREMMAAVARNRRQYTGTDSGTDAYQFDGNGDLATDDVVDIDIGSANTTATPTLENTGGSPSGAQSIVTTQGAAFVGMLEARPHRFQWDGTNYVVLDPAGGVVDKGSNANGEFVQYGDGTLICRVSGFQLSFSSTVQLEGVWTFPATFASAPVVTTSIDGDMTNATITNAEVSYLYVRTTSTTSATIRLNKIASGSDCQAGDTANAHAIAIGEAA